MEEKWHTKASEEIFSILNTRKTGLSQREVATRLEEYGFNSLLSGKPDNVFLIFLRQFASPLIYILLLAALVVYIMGEPADAVIIAAVLVFNAIIGTIQEGRAQNTLLALKKLVETKAVVIRGGEEFVIPDAEVVPGDILLINEGETISADARIFLTHNLKVDEATLTGESEPVFKNTETLSLSDAAPIDQRNMVFRGTLAVSGNAMAVVVETGTNTVIGRIAREIATIDTEIPLKADIRFLSRIIIGVTLVVSALIFFLGLRAGLEVREMFATAVSVVVSVIPSGLPIALTLILATGVWRMSKKNALVKRLQAVEALGQAEVIAVDKTGTITKNELVVQKVWIGGRTYDVGGIGYEPVGEISFRGKAINFPDHPEIVEAGRIASFCASARTIYSEEDKSWKVVGDPTEAALLVLGEKLGFKKDKQEELFPLIGEIPFDHKLKYHATVHRVEGKNLLTVVGAPEVILELSHKIKVEGKEKLLLEPTRNNLLDEYTSLAKEGLRVIAFATLNNVSPEISEVPVGSLTFVGFFAMRDALRPEVRKATERSLSAGIKVVMITGDHRHTAEALAREAMIFKEGDRVLTGSDIDGMSDKSLAEGLSDTTVFARVTPEHKLRIIRAYRSLGITIAMTGDGVNDAPSLVAADLGVAMGRIGTEVAKEASDIILLDDNFGSIVSAVEEGRSIYKTIKKVVLYLVSTSIGEVFVITGALILGMPLPLLPAQIIWLNFVTDGFFIPALAMEPKEPGLLKRTFRRTGKYFVDFPFARRMLLMALTMMIATLILFKANLNDDLTRAWTISLTLLAVFQWFNAWNCRSDEKSIFGMKLFSNWYLIGGTIIAFICQLIAIYHPFFQKYLRTTGLGISDWLIILAFASSIILVDEIRKMFARTNRLAQAHT